MPELPEVETVASTLYPHVHGAIFTAVSLLRESSLHPLSLPLESLIGQTISGTSRRGKLLIFNIYTNKPDSTEFLIAHLRMTGRMFTRPANTDLGRHTRCIFQLKDAHGHKRELFFDDTRAFGQLLVANQQILESWDFWRTLGPEPLEIDAACMATRLKGSRPLKSALLDQRVIAGIGNIYADETLFQAGLSPLRPAGKLTLQETEALLEAIQDILRRSISQCGSSIKDYRDADGKSGSFQKTFRVYGRGGKKCKKCGATLQKIRLAGRATVFCENCQK